MERIARKETRTPSSSSISRPDVVFFADVGSDWTSLRISLRALRGKGIWVYWLGASAFISNGDILVLYTVDSLCRVLERVIIAIYNISIHHIGIPEYLLFLFASEMIKSPFTITSLNLWSDKTNSLLIPISLTLIFHDPVIVSDVSHQALRTRSRARFSPPGGTGIENWERRLMVLAVCSVLKR